MNKRIEIDALKLAKPLNSFIDDLTANTKDMYAALKREQKINHMRVLF